jgi:hypothetical protein
MAGRRTELSRVLADEGQIEQCLVKEELFDEHLVRDHRDSLQARMISVETQDVWTFSVTHLGCLLEPFEELHHFERRLAECHGGAVMMSTSSTSHSFISVPSCSLDKHSRIFIYPGYHTLIILQSDRDATR